jgi:hypothetical protein
MARFTFGNEIKGDEVLHDGLVVPMDEVRDGFNHPESFKNGGQLMTMAWRRVTYLFNKLLRITEVRGGWQDGHYYHVSA